MEIHLSSAMTAAKWLPRFELGGKLTTPLRVIVAISPTLVWKKQLSGARTPSGA